MSLKAYALTTRARLMEFIGLTSVTVTQGNVLDNLINQVTEYVEKTCGRRFKKTTYAEEYTADEGADILLLNNYPVISTESFTLQYRNTTKNSNSWSTISSEDYFVDYASGIVRLTTDAEFVRGTRIYKASYTAGFDFDNVATFLSDTEAGDLEYVVWKLCETAYNKRKQSGDIENERIGDYSVTYAKGMFENADMKAIVDRYKKIDNVGLPTGNLYP